MQKNIMHARSLSSHEQQIMAWAYNTVLVLFELACTCCMTTTDMTILPACTNSCVPNHWNFADFATRARSCDPYVTALSLNNALYVVI